jgi:putative ABC transport system ATP-binding protein
LRGNPLLSFHLGPFDNPLMTAEILKLQSLRFRHKVQQNSGNQATLIVEQFSMLRGQTVLLQGRSGSGKSTLLNLIAGMLRPDSGEICVLGQPLNSLTASQLDQFRAKNIGVIFQKLNLVPYLNAMENIQLAVFLAKNKVSDSEVINLLKTLNLSVATCSQPIDQLSIGQQQRVAIARSLINKPKLIIADEPTSALDDENANDFMGLLFDIAQQFDIGVLFVSHDTRWRNRFDKHYQMNDIAMLLER